MAAELQRFGANIRRERNARNLTQEKLAELADLNIRTVQKNEAGEFVSIEGGFKFWMPGIPKRVPVAYSVPGSVTFMLEEKWNPKNAIYLNR